MNIKLESKNWKLLLFTAFAGVCLLFSCKNSDRPLEAESQTVLDNAMAEAEFAAIRNIVDMEARSDTNLYTDDNGRVNSRFCTWSTTNITQQTPSRYTMEVDFSSGTNCQDGRLRTGKLNVEFLGLWNQNGSTATVSAQDYTTSGEAMEFTQLITCLGQNSDGQDQWTSAITQGFIYTDLGPILWEGENTYTQVEGQDTPDLWDNIYQVEGSASGKARNTIDFTTTIIDPLRVRLDCRQVVTGVSEIIPSGFPSRTLAYGAGTCDNLGLLTIGDWSAEISLPQ